ncbi:helix-turn-helix domain-containing protein [Flagellimonas algicola]|uniref:Helix-turn-helix transcriptional regulator n=1 Tax=Flagellimonas algicola TaxID=2583815 RepID=A0ABY2WIY6_9FLAO|nr:helix-turn-helix transcriptional regulator [Allomuricauda algicola]TMU54807.1 helix-turn-helix transcriptional regulator [Allomuricauda algicola]
MTTQENRFLKKVGKNIAQHRRKAGFSQLDICAEIKMEKPNLSAIENGRQNITALTMLKIADAIGVDVKDFFGSPSSSKKHE